MAIISVLEMMRIIAVQNLAGEYKEASLKSLEEITQKMAEDKEGEYDISLLFAQNTLYFNTTFSKIVEIYGYVIEQRERKFFLVTPKNE